MKLAALFSGGKDSTYSIYLAKKDGHEIKCLITVFPRSDESHLLHHPNIRWTTLQADAMQLPQLITTTDNNETINETINETRALEKILSEVKTNHEIEGLVHGGIKSKFQKEHFESICNKLNIKSFAPLWDKQSEDYMTELLSNNFEFVITSVSADGLDDSWLNKKITNNDLNILKGLSQKHSFNLDFEGGEAETFVTNCPLFSKAIKISRGNKIWDGYRGRFEIVEAELDNNA